MAANVTIYAPTSQVISLEKLRELEGHNHIVARRKALGGSVVQLCVTWDNCRMTINVMKSKDIPAHLTGLRGYVAHLLGNEVNEKAKALLHCTSIIKQVLGIIIEPGWDTQGKCKRLVLGITKHYKGWFFADNAMYNDCGNLVLGPSGARTKFFLDDQSISASAIARKERSEAMLEQEEIPINTDLPIIDEFTARLQSKENVARRAMALCLVAAKGEGLEQDYVLQVMREYRLESALTPRERTFVFNGDPSEQDRINFAWKYEGYWVLLWALGYIDQLGRPDHICDVSRAVTIMKDRTAEKFVEDAQLRSLVEILDYADLIYRYHWAIVDARIKGKELPVNLNPGVVYERHYALNWLIGRTDQEWDDVTTDT